MYQQPQMKNPITLKEALLRSTYPKFRHEFLESFIKEKFSDPAYTQLYLVQMSGNKNILTIEYKLSVPCGDRFYDLNMLLYLPELFPDYQPEFYIHPISPIGINKVYLNGKIDANTLRINISNFKPFIPEELNIEEIVSEIFSSFTQSFPVYRSNGNVNYSGPCNLNLNFATPVNVPKNENFSDKNVLDIVKAQVKNMVKTKFEENEKTCRIHENAAMLNQINNQLIGKLNSQNLGGGGMNFQNGNDGNIENDLMVLYQIKEKLSQMENVLQKEVEEKNAKSKEEDFLEKYKACIEIKNEEDFRLVVMKKTIEDYLKFLKKGFEKKVIGLEDCIRLTRKLSLELFSIDYLRKKNNEDHI